MKRVAIAVIVLVVAFVSFYLWRGVSVLDGGGATQFNTANVFVHQTLAKPLEHFRLDVGRYPTTDEGLKGLFMAPAGMTTKWKGPYTPEETPRDPWGRIYQYRFPGVRNAAGYDLWSLGPDGVESDDDIGNWKKPNA